MSTAPSPSVNYPTCPTHSRGQLSDVSAPAARLSSAVPTRLAPASAIWARWAGIQWFKARSKSSRVISTSSLCYGLTWSILSGSRIVVKRHLNTANHLLTTYFNPICLEAHLYLLIITRGWNQITLYFRNCRLHLEVGQRILGRSRIYLLFFRCH